MTKLTKVCAIVAVKGGVGKTMTSINVARRLADKYGVKVGLIDADFDNSNFSQFTNTNAEIQVVDSKEFRLYDWKGIQVFSMSLLAGREKSVSMTGDRYAQMLDDCLRRSNWDVDYLIIDLPGGSSDVFRSVMQLFGENVIGNIIVSQPSMVDALNRILNLHKYFEIPALGVVENMSYYECPDCHQVSFPFGQGKTREICKFFNTSVIGEIPLSNEIAEKMIEGEAILQAEYQDTIDKCCELIQNAEIVKTGLFSKIKDKIEDKMSEMIQKSLIKVLVSVNTAGLDFGKIRRNTGFTERKVFRLQITDPSFEHEITSLELKLTDEGLKFITNPKKVEFEIVTDFKTLARTILRKRKVKGVVEKFEGIDAFLNGEIKIYGEGHSAKAMTFFHDIFGSEELMQNMDNRLKSILEMFI